MTTQTNIRFQALLQKKILAIDFGEKYIGLATFIPGSDPYPLGLDRIRFEGQDKLLTSIKSIIQSESIDVLVLGLPKLLDGKETNSTKKIRLIGEKIRKEFPQILFYFQDETLTTFDAKDRMKNSPEFNFQVAMDKIDMVSAVIILEDFIASKDRL